MRSQSTRFAGRRRPRLLPLFLVLSVAAPTLGQRLDGRWSQDPFAGDPGYLAGEYPGWSMTVREDGDLLEVTQTLGAVQDGLPVAGSGDTSTRWSVVVGGAEETVRFGDVERRVRATREGDDLRVEWRIGEEGKGVVAEEVWRVTEQGRLEIDRRLGMGERVRESRLVLRRSP